VNGFVTDTYDYDAFGNLIAVSGSTPNLYLFTGEQYDADLGLYHLRARYQYTRTGRFWTMDQFETFSNDPASLHRYTYCEMDPVNGLDPTGNLTLQEINTGLGIVADSFTKTVSFTIYAAQTAALRLGAFALSRIIAGAGAGIYQLFGTSPSRYRVGTHTRFVHADSQSRTTAISETFRGGG
jgi:RHS repeat-associated protein